MTPIRLERREAAHNRQRFYTIAVTRTLFDGWVVVRAKVHEAPSLQETAMRRD